ncbi:helicase-related protein [Micromonospora luteifusca]|uniref:helicase-related protein n=1 Tax=Micromonospora luteifusca TaxID=709860 RepID=UPI0033A1FD23
MVDAGFPPGSLVRLVARPEVVGVVRGAGSVGGAVRYDVFHGDRTHSYFASQLELVPAEPQTAPISGAALRAGLTSELLRDPNTAYLHARNAGRIDYEPYQYRPVLKIVQAERPRILVADDVGVGKTIEACLIIKELQARHRARSVLVICPKGLVVDDKWRGELKRFDEEFVHLDGAALRFCVEETLREDEWPARFSKAILPYSLLDRDLLEGVDRDGIRRPGLVDLAPGPRFDLVIIDEAHHIRNRPTYAYRNVARLTEAAEAVVMLSATPLQIDSQDLFTLVNLLRDDLVPTERDFAQMLEPNHYLYEAVEAARGRDEHWQEGVQQALSDALATRWGRQVMAVDPRVGDIRDLLGAPGNDNRARVRVVRALEDLNTFSSIVTRTRRRDIGEFTTRKPAAPMVAFTPRQQVVHDAVLALGRQISQLQAPGMPTEFLLSMLYRQAASSISGLAPLVEQMLNNRLDTVEFGEVGDDAPLVPPRILSEVREQIESLGELAADLDGERDPKLDLLRQLVVDKQTQANNKVLLFSTFRHTLAYLLRAAQEWGVRAAVMHGEVPDAERYALRRRFKLPRDNPDAVDLLLSSEVGTEGLDFQWCDTLVNYDIPWNPMRIEQRIGRIDRRGQRSPSVAIVNILTEGTIEAEIYRRCLSRIGVFHRAVGGSERILGDLTTQLRRIADDLTLSDADRVQRLQQLADNEVRRIEEAQRLEDAQADLLGLTTESLQQRIAEASSEWLDSEKLGDLVRTYLGDVLGGRRIAALKPGKVVTVRLDDGAAARIGDDVRAAGGDARIERLLRRKEPVLRLTIDPGIAADEDDVELISPTHPLVLTAATGAALDAVPWATLKVHSTAVPPGVYPVAIHGWTRLDARDSLTLRYVSTDPQVEAHAGALLAAAVDGGPDLGSGLTPDDLDALAERHNAEWQAARETHVARAGAVAEQRIASLRAQRDSQMRAIEESLRDVTDPRILRMRNSELNSVRDRYDRLIKQHDRKPDLTTRAFATVLLEVAQP